VLLQAEAKLPVEPGEFQESFKPFLMDVIFQWSKVTAVTLFLCGPTCRDAFAQPSKLQMCRTSLQLQ
jgi:hypothetical protein